MMQFYVHSERKREEESNNFASILLMKLFRHQSVLFGFHIFDKNSSFP
jgi:hypothetical protein